MLIVTREVCPGRRLPVMQRQLESFAQEQNQKEPAEINQPETYIAGVFLWLFLIPS